MAQNFLYYGDNLDILRRYIRDETVDLIYLDPPFKSNQNYNVLFQEQNGLQSKAQVKVFEDTWRWDQESAEAYQGIVEKGPEKVSRTMQAFRTFLGDNDMLAYLSMMAPRLVELRRVLKPAGSIYLHCDPTASHYLKLLMDAVFEANRFLNEIVWCYRQGGRSNRLFGRKHDIIFWYSKTDEWVFNAESPSVRVQYHGTGGFQTSGKGVTHKTGKTYKPDPRGKIVEDWWDIPALPPMSKERLGYPTQKPEALLDRIIEASSNEGDIILDPFCGCGTAIAVSQRLNRRWIGIDITHLAVGLIKHRLQDAFGSEINSAYHVIGEPTDLASAKILADEDPYQFQWWTLGLVGARPVEQKKGADKGIDGRLYFHDEADKKTKQIVLQVKGGHVSSAHIRDLRGVLDREKAEIGAFVTLQKPSKAMRSEAAGAGFYHSPGWNKDYPRIQILTIEQLLGGKTIDYPASDSTSTTFKKASRPIKEQGKQEELFES
ncbi:MAG: DNA methyltransferase [Nanoarchaeota archaeon]